MSAAYVHGIRDEPFHCRWWGWDGGSWIGWNYGYYPFAYYGDDYYVGGYGEPDPYYHDDRIYDGGAVSNERVRALQSSLARRGYYYGTVNGVYGSATRAAVARAGRAGMAAP